MGPGCARRVTRSSLRQKAVGERRAATRAWSPGFCSASSGRTRKLRRSTVRCRPPRVFTPFALVRDRAEGLRRSRASRWPRSWDAPVPGQCRPAGEGRRFLGAFAAGGRHLPWRARAGALHGPGHRSKRDRRSLDDLPAEVHGTQRLFADGVATGALLPHLSRATSRTRCAPPCRTRRYLSAARGLSPSEARRETTDTPSPCVTASTCRPVGQATPTCSPRVS